MALSFSGTGQYLTFASSLITAAPLTLACWFKVAVVNGNNVAQGISNNSSDNSSFVQTIVQGPPIKLRAQAALTGSSSSSASATIAPVGVWLHCVGVFASATSRTSYVNAVASGSDPTSKVPTGLNVWSIGASFAGTSTAVNLITGAIAYPAIWNTALSGADITALYNGGLGVDPLTIQTGSCVSMLYLNAAGSSFDTVQASSWTVVGSPTFTDDPFVALPSTSSGIVLREELASSMLYVIGDTHPAIVSDLQNHVPAPSFLQKGTLPEIRVPNEYLIEYDKLYKISEQNYRI